MTASVRIFWKPFAPGVNHVPKTQHAAPKPRRIHAAPTALPLPVCEPSTPSSQTTVPSMRKPMACLRRTIQSPGLGRYFIQPGRAVRSR